MQIKYGSILNKILEEGKQTFHKIFHIVIRVSHHGH